MKRENILAPSILAADFTRLGEDIQTVAAPVHSTCTLTSWTVPSSRASPLGCRSISSIRKITDLFFDVHLMMEKPERYIQAFCRLWSRRHHGTRRGFHHLHRTIQSIHAAGARAEYPESGDSCSLCSIMCSRTSTWC